MSASPHNGHKGLAGSGSNATGHAMLKQNAKPGAGIHLPERYIIKTNDSERVLTCLEAPNLNVHVEKGLSFSGSVARKSPSRTIFIDGVANCEPFMDHERQVYNLDHHEGCVRAFTLSACEQALVMHMKGLDLQGREWNIFANEPDLDTLLAVWIILNHSRIDQQDANQRRILFALVRYEGVIDALGLELRELSALPADLMRKIQRVIDHLRSNEIALKKEGAWEETDYLDYTAGVLHKIDQIFYKPSDFTDYLGLDELARIDITDQRIAVVVEADMGIYEIEPQLNKLYGNRLGIVFLKKGPNTYTMRQMDLFMPTTLEDVYEQLNFVDANVRCRTLTNKWGGAADIGGSPRETGTRLTPYEIVQAARTGVSKPKWSKKANRYLSTTALIGFIVLCAHIISRIWQPAKWFGHHGHAPFWEDPAFGFILTLLIAAGICLVLIAHRRPWQYGWAWPMGKQWWVLLPPAVAGAMAGGVWSPTTLGLEGEPVKLVLLVVIGMPLATEILLRSLAHGLLSQSARIQRVDTRWFLSWPTVGSSLIYVGFMLSLYLGHLPEGDPLQVQQLILCIAGAMLLGLSVGMARERSQSFLPAALFHMIAALVALLMMRL